MSGGVRLKAVIVLLVGVLGLTGLVVARGDSDVARRAAPLVSNEVRNVLIAGRGEVPTEGVGMVAVNITIVAPDHDTTLTMWPGGEERPTLGNIHARAGETSTAPLLVALGPDGTIDMQLSSGSADVIVDQVGWFTTASGVRTAPVDETALLNPLWPPVGSVVRTMEPFSLFDFRHDAPVTAHPDPDPSTHGSVIDVQVAGLGGVPASGAGAVLLDIEVARATVPTILSVWPTGLIRPFITSVTPNLAASTSTTVLTRLGDDGHISIFDYEGSSDLTVRAVGWIGDDDSFVGRIPTRIYDSRELDNTASAFGSGGVTTCPATPSPVVDAASLNTALSGHLGDWIGGDTGEEVVLADGTLLLLMGDTLIGENDGIFVPRPYWYVSNSVLRITGDGCVTPIWGRGDLGNPFDDVGWIRPDHPAHRLWPASAWVAGDRLFVWVGDYFMDESGPAGWNFHFVEMHLATIKVSDIGLREPTLLADSTWKAAESGSIELGIDAVVEGGTALITGRGSTPETAWQRYVMSVDAFDPTGSAPQWLRPDGSWGLEPVPLDWGPGGASMRVGRVDDNCWIGTSPASVFAPESTIFHSTTLAGGWTEVRSAGVPHGDDRHQISQLSLRYYLHHVFRLDPGRWLLGVSRNIDADRLGSADSVPIDVYRPIYGDIPAPSC